MKYATAKSKATIQLIVPRATYGNWRQTRHGTHQFCGPNVVSEAIGTGPAGQQVETNRRCDSVRLAPGARATEYFASKCCSISVDRHASRW